MYSVSAFLMTFFIFISPTVSAQSEINTKARTILVELGNLVKDIPETKKECQELLQQIKIWQQEKLKKLKTPETEIQIIEPKEGDLVPERPYIKGIVADPDAKVWVIIHPMEVSDYWVQPRVIVKRDGNWVINIYIGRPGKIDVGKHFEIMAVANPKEKLTEGEIFGSWPDAVEKSEIIEVIRR